jgi:hypothetical protein
MSAAWYIVLERKIPGFDPFVNGKALARAGEKLEKLAKAAGVTPLMKFFIASPDELAEFAADHGASLKGAGVESAEQWFSPGEGLKVVHVLLEAVEKQAGDAGVVSDLKEFQSVLETAQKHGVRWHLAVDF